MELSQAGLEVCEKFGDVRVSPFPWITPHAIVPFSVKNDEVPGPICVSLFGANAVVLEATDGPNLIEQFRIVRLTAPGKMPAMTDLDGATIKLNPR